LPGGPLGIGQHRGLAQERAHAVELGARGGVQPAEAADAMKARGQHVLQEAANEFEGLQVQVLPMAGGAFAVTPAHAAIREQGQVAIAGGGLKDVAAQIAQRSLA